jgi:TAG lipase/steryl ester hydrolase/phospholipase A2/LPA acyltransferase
LYTHFPRILKNPTSDFMLKACLCGERATWPKLARVRNHCSIELALDAAIQKMRARVALSHTHATLVTNTLTHHSAAPASSSDRGRRRRSSCSHEYEKRKHAESRSSRPSLAKIGRSMSHSFESYHPQADQEAEWLWIRRPGFEPLNPESNSSNDYGTETPAFGSYHHEQSYFSPDPEFSMECSKAASSSSSASLSPVRMAKTANYRPPTPAAVSTSPRRQSHPMRSTSPPRLSLRMTPASPGTSRLAN